MTLPTSGLDQRDHTDDGGYQAARDSAAYLVWPRDVLSVSGADATTYLQGQCSQDVAALDQGSSADSLLLSPQGKVEALVRISRLGEDHFVIDTDPGLGSVVQARLERFRLRVKVDIEAVDWTCVAVRGPRSAEVVVGRPAVTAVVDWPGFAGLDLLGPADAEVSGWLAEDVAVLSEATWEALRIEAGFPVNGREVTEGSIAAEVGLVDRSVSFTKGCFTGQELVARLDARGSNVARRLCGLVLAQPISSSEENAVLQAAVFTADGEHEVGRVSSIAWSPSLGSTVALATLHRRVVAPETVALRWLGPDGGPRHAEAEARTLPLLP
jgi:folate-binding protein YgfZ